MSKPTSLLAAVLLAAACGGSDGIPEGDDLGEGTGTLVVSARMTAENRIPNASDPNDFTTDLEVSVTRDGLPVTDALVLVTSEAGEVELTHSATEPGSYDGVQTGYAERYVLDVTAGDDELVGARVDGPAIHVITAPAPGGQVQGGAPVEVTWEADDEVESASIETEEMERTSIADTGSYSIPADGLKHDEGQTKDERIRLWRENRIAPTGGAGGSSFEVSVRQEIEIVVLP